MYTGYKKTGNFLLTFIFITLWSASAHAIIVPPTGYGPDNGAGLFTHGDMVISIEAYDLLGSLAPAAGTIFGFYFTNTPAQHIPIFTQQDQVTSKASINFISGEVIDLDTNTLVANFSGAGDIGFFILLDPTNIDSFIYSDPSRNSLNSDLTAVFPSLSDPFIYALGFEGYDANGAPLTLALEVVAGVKAIIPKPIPEPQILLLMLGGLLALALRRRGIS